MKSKKIILVFILCIITLFISSCEQKSSNKNIEEWVNPSVAINIDGMNLYWQQDNLQVLNDNQAKLSLYTNAEMLGNNEFAFDDRNEWLLVLETSLGNYELFPRNYIQLGGIDCSTYYTWNENTKQYDTLNIIVTIRQSASYRIDKYVFDSDKKAFKLITLLNEENIN